LLCRILKHVPVRKRLSDCALVCRAWAAAAEAATTKIDDWHAYSIQQVLLLAEWLAKHGGAVEVLMIPHGADKPRMFQQKWKPVIVQLPVAQFSQLQQLDFRDITALLHTSAAELGIATLSISDRQASVLAGASSRGATNTGGAAAAAAAAFLPKLQDLTVSLCDLTAPLASQLLSATALTYLCMDHVKLYIQDSSDDARPHSWHSWHPLPCEQEGALVLEALQQMPRLFDLQLSGISMATAADLAPIGNLQHLRFLHIRIGRHHSAATGDPQPQTGLLAALQRLTQLRHLSLAHCCLNGAEPQTLSALTASTQLTNLQVFQQPGLPIPLGAVDHMLPAGRVLPHLVRMVLEKTAWHNPQLFCVEEAQIARIAAGCPRLEYLCLGDVTPAYFDKRCLLQLPMGVNYVEGRAARPFWTRPGT
jgi:hypothetical protein